MSYKVIPYIMALLSSSIVVANGLCYVRQNWSQFKEQAYQVLPQELKDELPSK